MNWMVYIYYFFMVTCFTTSLFFLRIYQFRLLSALLFTSIAVETVAECMGTKNLSHFILYHFFNIVEYAFITLILRSFITLNLVKIILDISIPLFTFASIFIGLSIQPFSQFPSIACNIEGVLVVTWSLIALWSMSPNDTLTISRQPKFWIILGFFIYFSGTMAFNGIYNSSLKNKTDEAKKLFAVINSCCNYLLYIFLTIGILCCRYRKNI